MKAWFWESLLVACLTMHYLWKILAYIHVNYVTCMFVVDQTTINDQREMYEKCNLVVPVAMNPSPGDGAPLAVIFSLPVSPVCNRAVSLVSAGTPRRPSCAVTRTPRSGCARTPLAGCRTPSAARPSPPVPASPRPPGRASTSLSCVRPPPVCPLRPEGLGSAQSLIYIKSPLCFGAQPLQQLL